MNVHKKKLKVFYVRVFIEVDITTKLMDQIIIRYQKGNKLTQPVEYEWEPPFYIIYKKVGHECKEKKIQKQKRDDIYVWIEKKTEHTNGGQIEKPKQNADQPQTKSSIIEKQPEWTMV